MKVKAKLKVFTLCLSLILFFLQLTLNAKGQSTGDDLLIPSDRPLFALLRRSEIKPPGDQTRDVLKLADLETDELAQRTSELLSDPASYPHFVLRLHQFVKNYVAHNSTYPEAIRIALNEPTYFFLSDRQGGFAANGFWLEETDGSLRDMSQMSYVDIQFEIGELDGDDFGDVNQIFPHELGHIIMRELAGEPEQTAFAGIHFVTVRSDPWIAFGEGWAEHFQPAAIDHNLSEAVRERRLEPLPSAEDGWYARFARELASGCYFCPANLAFLFWQGKGEQHLRDGAVRNNHFVHQVVLPQALMTDRRDPYEALLYRDVIPPSPDAPLKNGAQMLASEGVISTLFYRLVTDARLQNTYREPAFYESFLLPGQSADWGQVEPQDLFTPGENVCLKLFDVFARYVTWEVGHGPSPMLQVIAGYTERFPDEAETVLSIFLEMTRGVTVDAGAATHTAEPNYLSTLQKRLLQGDVKLDDNLGPPLWLSNDDFKGGFGVFRYFSFMRPPLNFDLNAADAADLRTVPGMTVALADRIIAAREEQGHFDGLEDLAQVDGMTPALLERFQTMQARMEQELMTSKRENNPSLLSLLLILLISSYGVAALFQIGRLLVLATLMYNLVSGIAWGIRHLNQETISEKTSWFRRGLRSVRRGMGVALLAFLASLGLYVGGLAVTPWIMGGLGLLAWILSTASQVLLGYVILQERRWMTWSLAAWLATFAITGVMY